MTAVRNIVGPILTRALLEETRAKLDAASTQAGRMNIIINRVMDEALRLPRVEPQPRMHAGRHGWVVHRFPIKGGISCYDMMGRALCDGLTVAPTILHVLERRR